MLWTRRISMKNHRFPWLRNRTTDNRKCEKARNIKEKCTIEMFSTAWRLLVARPSSASADRDFKMPQNPGNATVSGAFLFWFCCFLLRKFDALYPIFNGLTIGENRVWSDEWVKNRGKSPSIPSSARRIYRDNFPSRYLCFALNPFGEVYSRLYHIRMVETQLPIAVAGPFLFSDIPMMNARRRRPWKNFLEISPDA